MYRLNISYKQFHVTLNEIWLYESDPNASSTCSEHVGKQWQNNIRARRNYMLVTLYQIDIRHLDRQTREKSAIFISFLHWQHFCQVGIVANLEAI